jgi:GPH family glycoside/pentoside/hexuronide:cation symporter
MNTLVTRPGWLHFGWGVGTLGAALLLNSFAALQLYYLTSVLAVPIATASLLLFVAKLWDWVANPLMGLISDRTSSRWGRRRPYLVLGGVVSALGLIAYFTSALTPVGDSLLLITLSLAVVGTGYTIFNVPYMAMPSELEEDYKARTRMFRWRVLFIGIGTVLGTGAQRLAEILGGGAEGYARMSLFVAAGVFIFMALPFLGTAGGRQLTVERHSMPLWQQVRTGLANRPFLALLGAKFTQLFGLFTITAMTIFVIRYVLDKENPGAWMLYYTVIAFIVQTLTIPVWTRVTEVLEKRQTYMLSTLILALVSLSWLLASAQEPFWVFALRAAFKGFALSGILLMGQSMLPDTIEYDYRMHGVRREGVFAGLYSIVEKVAASFAPTLLGLGYAWFGFQSAADVQTVEALDGIRYSAALLPALYFGLSLIPIYFYRLTEQSLANMEIHETRSTEATSPELRSSEVRPS